MSSEHENTVDECPFLGDYPVVVPDVVSVGEKWIQRYKDKLVIPKCSEEYE